MIPYLIALVALAFSCVALYGLRQLLDANDDIRARLEELEEERNGKWGGR
jgi:hypothetical protein